MRPHKSARGPSPTRTISGRCLSVGAALRRLCPHLISPISISDLVPYSSDGLKRRDSTSRFTPFPSGRFTLAICETSHSINLSEYARNIRLKISNNTQYFRFSA
ncbi:Hypothetical protein NTJ_06156 [Nesidiocoris tenuis]|uniref:Uncharacterized protein n=1 Tax=Nesidiocoris tenuis TaxID=355587 RepID=A0ABN7APW1_9HEMI|nr:Hypothetical protein NTJ_06156 [Nesidiocoris tenuis]